MSGLAVEHQRLTADIETMHDDDGMDNISYQWFRDGLPISGATGQSYLLTAIDVGSQISVMVSFVDGRGTMEQVRSASSGIVAKDSEPEVPDIIVPPEPKPEPGIDETGVGIVDPDINGGVDPEPEGTVDPEASITGNATANEKEEAPRSQETEKVEEASVSSDSDEIEGIEDENEGHESTGHDHSMRFNSMSAELRTRLDIVRFNLGKVDPVVFYQAIDTSVESLGQPEQMFGTPQVKLTMSMGAALSAGFVTWALRGGAILSALMSTMPAWRGFDPMVILSDESARNVGLEEGELTHAERVFDATGVASSTKSSPSSFSYGVKAGINSRQASERGTL